MYGNILAVLFNVLDVARARIAFRFMWGVGINDPWPVKNLYPVVHSGDPDWRPYYTVNLLNLPHHYHNGGIWPFIGASGCGSSSGWDSATSPTRNWSNWPS